MDDERSDMLSGYAEIAGFLRLTTPRKAKNLAETGGMPTFKLPGSNIVRARRSTLTAWLAEQEAAGRKPAPAP